MGNYRSRRAGVLQGWQMDAALMMFQGYTDDEIVEKVLEKGQRKIADMTYRERASRRMRLHNLRKNDDFLNYYKSLITEWSVHNVGPALNKLAEQMKSAKEPWLVNKAANDILNRGLSAFETEEANKIKVEIVGLPELGSPDNED